VTRIIDASIACKWYLDENGSTEARALLEDLETLLVAPDIIIAEVTNVLWLRLRRGEIEEEQATLAASHLADSFLTLIPSRALIGRALVIAREIDHPIYDCLYLATAERWEADFVTADKRLGRKLAESTLAIPLLVLG
jgi:predicted nucleic acid-binding protein